MRKILLAICLFLAPVPAFAQGVPNTSQVVATCGTPPTAYSAGLNYPNLQNTSGQQCINATVSVTPTGTQNTNTTQIGSNPVSVGSGASNTGTQRVITSSDSTIGVVSSGTFAAQITSTVTAIGVTPTDHTITSATGASQTVMGANTSRRGITIENTGNANCGINPTGGTAVIGGTGTITISPLGAYTPRIPTLSVVTAICSSGQPLYASEN